MNANEGSSYSSSAGKVASPLQKQHSAETRCRSSTLQHHAESHSTGRGCCCQRCAKRVELNASEGSSCSSAGEVVSPLPCRQMPQKQHRAAQCPPLQKQHRADRRCRSSTVQHRAAKNRGESAVRYLCTCVFKFTAERWTFQSKPCMRSFQRLLNDRERAGVAFVN